MSLQPLEDRIIVKPGEAMLMQTPIRAQEA